MWTVRITDSQREALIAILEAQGELGPSLGGALEELEFARWDELPDAELPWERVAELAEAQGIGEADVVWDLAGGLVQTRRASGQPAAKKPPARAAQRSRG